VIQQQRFSLSRAREKLKANPKDTTMAAWFDHTFGSGMAN
jgi:hypothetical protein